MNYLPVKRLHQSLHSSALIWPTIIAIPLIGYFFLVAQNWLLLVGAVSMVGLAMVLMIRPLYGLLALVAMRSSVDILGNHSVALGGFSINVAGLLSLVAIIWAGWYLVNYQVKVWRTPIFWPITLLLMISAGGLLYTISPSATGSELLRLGGVFVLYFVAFDIFRRDHDRRNLALALGASLLLPMLLGGYQYITHTGLSFADDANRIFGTFGHPNVFAFYLVLIITYFFSSFLAQNPDRRSLGSLFFLGLLVVLLYLTATRGAWIGLMTVLLTLGFGRYRRALLSLFLVGIILVVATPLANSLTVRYFDLDLSRISVVHDVTERLQNTSSWQWRQDVWKEMGRKFYEQPVQGYGLGSFPILRQQQVFDFFQGIGAHNDYLRLIIETGILGLSAYVILLVGLLYYLIRSYHRAAPAGKIVSLGIIGYALALMFMSFFDNILQATAVMWFWWIIVASIVSQPTKKTLK